MQATEYSRILNVNYPFFFFCNIKYIPVISSKLVNIFCVIEEIYLWSANYTWYLLYIATWKLNVKGYYYMRQNNKLVMLLVYNALCDNTSAVFIF